MKKSELKTGMVVTIRDDDSGIVLKDSIFGDVIIFKKGWSRLDNIQEENLKNTQGSRFDIIEVKDPKYCRSFDNLLIGDDDVIWKEQKEYTIEQLETIVGHKIKIVGE